MIFDDIPGDWQQLEERVAQAFNEMGCAATRNCSVPKIRSRSQIDVVVKDPTLSPPALYLCECKYWARAVPKCVVQQLRTVVADSGANLGIIISKKGFQKGARDEVKSTNIRLYSWQDFQAAFEERWTNTVAERFKELVHECCDLSGEAYVTDSSPEGERLAWQLHKAISDETLLLMKVVQYEQRILRGDEADPICETRPELKATSQDRWVHLRTKRQYFDYGIALLVEHKRKLLERLAVLRSHPPADTITVEPFTEK